MADTVNSQVAVDRPDLMLADHADDLACQGRVDAAWSDPERWTRMSILNSARSGKFSSDSEIGEYCDRIWKAGPVPVALTG